jgi:hypothetical protein
MSQDLRRELYRSPNGDAWYLMRDSIKRLAFVRHKPNAASGGKESDSEIGAFLAPGANGPEHQALLRLIGTLVETRGVR